MENHRRAPASTSQLFVRYAAISLVPVVALGAVLAVSYRAQAKRRGRTEARSDALLVAQTAVEPLLEGHMLDEGLTTDEQARLNRLVGEAHEHARILRLRLRTVKGVVIYSGDGSGLAASVDDEAIEAAQGEVIATLTHLNSDVNDNGPRGIAAAEAYVPLKAGAPIRTVGVLEVYLPYAPIQRDIAAGMGALYRTMAGGLALLYAVLFLITLSVSRGLRRLVAANAFLAEHDTLTELPNRALFHRRASQALTTAGAKTAGGQPAPVAIAIVDLDRFKEINDTLGHHNGDRLLADLAGRLHEHMRPGDTVARLGGDEFGIVLRDVTDPDGALHRLRAVVDKEIELSGLPVTVEASIGYALAPDDATDTDELLQRADVAMYAAKATHSGVRRYDDSQNHFDAGSLGLVAELRHAIPEGQLVLHYQPKATVPSGGVDAVEALVRWKHPKLGLLSPDCFLPLAEQTDLIDRLTDWVLERALTEIKQAAGPELAVAVNVSARNLAKDDFAARVLATLRRTGMPTDRLVIEITETALMADPERAAAGLRKLSAAGVRISIDDFGKGNTSLGYLASLPVHELKIDRSFVHDIDANDAHGAIVRSIVELGHNLSLQVVGEGVETDDVLNALESAGCDIAQGFLLARPMPIDKLEEWLRAVVASV